MNVKHLHLHLALLPAALMTAPPVVAVTDPSAGPGFTKYDEKGNELPPDATEWAWHWQHDTNVDWLNQNLGNKRVTDAEANELLHVLGDDWGRPSDKNWEAEIDRTKFGPALRNPDLFPGIRNEAYWANLGDAGGKAEFAWVVGLNGGSSHLYLRSNTAWVRPCRAHRG